MTSLVQRRMAVRFYLSNGVVRGVEIEVSPTHAHIRPYMTTRLLSYKARVFFLTKDIQRTNILRLRNSKAQSKVKRHLLTSYKVNDVTKRASRDDMVM